MLCCQFLFTLIDISEAYQVAGGYFRKIPEMIFTPFSRTDNSYPNHS